MQTASLGPGAVHDIDATAEPPEVPFGKRGEDESSHFQSCCPSGRGRLYHGPAGRTRPEALAGGQAAEGRRRRLRGEGGEAGVRVASRMTSGAPEARYLRSAPRTRRSEP